MVVVWLTCSLLLSLSVWRQAVSAGSLHTCGIEKGTGLMHCWGANAQGQTTPPAGVQEWVVSAAARMAPFCMHACMLAWRLTPPLSLYTACPRAWLPPLALPLPPSLGCPYAVIRYGTELASRPYTTPCKCLHVLCMYSRFVVAFAPTVYIYTSPGQVAMPRPGILFRVFSVWLAACV